MKQLIEITVMNIVVFAMMYYSIVIFRQKLLQMKKYGCASIFNRFTVVGSLFVLIAILYDSLFLRWLDYMGKSIQFEIIIQVASIYLFYTTWEMVNYIKAINRELQGQSIDEIIITVLISMFFFYVFGIIFLLYRIYVLIFGEPKQPK